MDILILNAPISADILTISENIIMWTVTNKIKLSLALINMIYCLVQVIWYVVKSVTFTDIEFIIRYSPMTFNNSYAILCITNLLSQHYQFKDVLKFIENNFWTLDQVEEDARLEILKDLAKLKKLMLCTIFLIMSSPCIYLPFTGVDYNNTFFPTIAILNSLDLWIPLKYFMTGFNYFILFPQSCFMGTFLCTQFLFVTHYRYQAIMIKWVLVNITRNLTRSDVYDIIGSTSCQKIISTKLVVCVKHHITISTFARMTTAYFYKTIFAHTMGGMSLIATHTYILVFHNGGSSPVAVMLNTIAAAIVCCLYGISGEVFKDQTDNILDATIKTKWLLFNTENRKTFMILLINLKRTFQIIAAGMFAINCTFVIWFFNKIFALLSVLSVMEQQ